TISSGPVEQEEPASQRHEDALSVLRDPVGDDAVARDALALAVRAVLGAQLLLASAQNVLRAEQHALLAGRHIELVEALHEVARSRAQEEHRIAVRRDANRRRLAGSKTPRRRVLVEEAGVGTRGGGCFGGHRFRCGHGEQRQEDDPFHAGSLPYFLESPQSIFRMESARALSQSSSTLLLLASKPSKYSVYSCPIRVT